MKRNQKGVTLISLVVTIVVMLIIAGAAIATLGGDNGLITRSQSARAGSTEAEVVEKMQMAYSSVSLDAMTKMSSEVGFKPSEHIDDFIPGIISDLESKNVNPITTYSTSSVLADGKYNVFKSGNSIFIVYKDTTFALGVPTTATTYPAPTTATTTSFPQDNQYAMLVGEIVFTTSSVRYVEPIKTVL